MTKILHSIGNFERISDHARNLTESAEELSGKGLELSEHALAELDKLETAVKEILDITVAAYETNDVDLAKKVEPLEEVIDILTETIKVRHIGRLRRGECTIENGFVLSDMLNNYERISDHCSNIAMAVLEMQLDGRAEPHEYLGKVRTMQDADYRTAYEEYETKYAI